MATRGRGVAQEHEHSQRVGLHARAPRGVGRRAGLRLSGRWHQRAEPRLPRGRRADRVLQVRHEELASFAACAHAKLTGEVGVCMATSGPGAIHLLNGLYDAKLDNAPVVAIVGQQKRMSLGGDFQQEVDLRSLYKDVAHEFVGECLEPRQAGHLVDRAVRTAMAERTVTALIVPSDVQELPYEEPPREHGAINSAVGY